MHVLPASPLPTTINFALSNGFLPIFSKPFFNAFVKAIFALINFLSPSEVSLVFPVIRMISSQFLPHIHSLNLVREPGQAQQFVNASISESSALRKAARSSRSLIFRSNSFSILTGLSFGMMMGLGLPRLPRGAPLGGCRGGPLDCPLGAPRGGPLPRRAPLGGPLPVKGGGLFETCSFDSRLMFIVWFTA